jgi:putative transposase
MRRNRLLREGASYHVCARINDRALFLERPEIKELFLDTLRRARKKYSFALDNICIMGNHFHLIIRPAPGQNLSRIMQWIMGVFAMAYNRAMGHTGHVWGKRFFSEILGSVHAYLRRFRYIDENPLKVGLVKSPEEWPWSRFRQDLSAFRV